MFHRNVTGVKKSFLQGPCLPTRASHESVLMHCSPSGTELKSMDEVKEYLLKDGTCKCGLECPLNVEATFDFDPQVIFSEPY